MTDRCTCDACVARDEQAREAGFDDFADHWYRRGETLSAAFAFSMAEQLAIQLFYTGATMANVLAVTHLPAEDAQICADIGERSRWAERHGWSPKEFERAKAIVAAACRRH